MANLKLFRTFDYRPEFFLVDLESISRDLPYESRGEEVGDFLRELRSLFLESRAIQYG